MQCRQRRTRWWVNTVNIISGLCRRLLFVISLLIFGRSSSAGNFLWLLQVETRAFNVKDVPPESQVHQYFCCDRRVRWRHFTIVLR
mmetsp:Transcript_40609/g.107619  ORF Transcript_40609/g.107619 Transcript_40609/m.107619 type:complete len:86 (-) Transcript_40609:118-375(-)